MSKFITAKVLETHHWTDRLFSFKTARDASFRFESGQFVMLGLEIEKKLLMRAYSIASATYDDFLEFFSIKVANGPLTSVLKDLRPGENVAITRKPTGTLLIDNLRSGRNLYLLATGTGLAPFLSLIKDPLLYGCFERIILAHGCRYSTDLAYKDYLTSELPQHQLVGHNIRNQLMYYPSVTREPRKGQPRLTALVKTGRMTEDLGLPTIDARFDRFMICGSMPFIKDMQRVLDAREFVEGTSAAPGDYICEKAFAG